MYKVHTDNFHPQNFSTISYIECRCPKHHPTLFEDSQETLTVYKDLTTAFNNVNSFIPGCEVFVGKIPRDVYEDELVPIFETVGKIYEVRLMMDFDGRNRGYAFVVYTQKKDAQACIKKLNNYEIRRGKMLGVCSSVDNCRLFVGGIPKKVKKQEILEEISKVKRNNISTISSTGQSCAYLII